MSTTLYKSKLSVRDTEKAIKFVKDTFQRNLVKSFGFERVSAPMIVPAGIGINDDLNGVERPVSFDIPNCGGATAEVVQSLAKWKRVALKRYGYRDGEGLYTDMNALRRDDILDAQHSVYVDQWDWEMVISKGHRTESFLKMVVTRIVGAIVDTLEETKRQFPQLTLTLSRDVKFITTQEALDLYPTLCPHERERALCREHGTVFLMKIGGALSDGKPHDGRAPDYDDWSLNGDILFYDEAIDDSVEISSMGIRVDSDSLLRQLEVAGATDKLKYDYHKQVLAGELPLSIGGGIGQSRLCMLLLEKAHIGEVQVGIWPDNMRAECEARGVKLL